MPAFESFLSAQKAKHSQRRAEAEHKSLLEQRGLQADKVRADLAKAERDEKKAQNISMLTRSAMSAQGPDRATAISNLAGVDMQAAQGIQKFDTAAQAEQDRKTEAAEETYGKASDRARVMTGEEQKQNVMALIGSAEQNGVASPEEAEQLWDIYNNQGPEAFFKVVDQSLGRTVDDGRVAAGGMRTMTNRQTGAVERFDMTLADERKTYQALGPDWLDTTSTKITGTLGEVSLKGPGVGESKEYRQALTSTQQSIASINDIMDMLDENPNINTWVAQAGGVINNLAAETEALFGVAGDDADLRDMTTYGEVLKEMGMANAELESLVVDLAYTTARSREGGVLSKSDVENAIRTIGGKNRDAETFKRVLNSFARRLDRNFRIKHTSLFGNDKPFEGDLGYRKAGKKKEVTAKTGTRKVSAGAIEKLAANDTPEVRRIFNKRYGEGMAEFHLRDR